MHALFALTAYGTETLLSHELKSLGVSQCQEVQGGVLFQADTHLLYRTLLWSRLASRILLILAHFPVTSDQDLYQGARAINWPALFAVDSAFAVHFTGTSAALRNTQYGAVKVKDAIVDCFRQQLSQRPQVDKQNPAIRIDVHLHRNQIRLSLDLSGSALHQRGYRQASGRAPLKENLAAAIVLRSRWSVDTPLIDPLCGAGTLLIEAALLAADIAPGLQRQQWGFQAWHDHQPEIWQALLTEAQQRAAQGVNRTTCRLWGYDNDAKVLAKARHNAQCAGVASLITFAMDDATQLKNPLSHGKTGTLISNPPYGERLSATPALIARYSAFGSAVKQHFAGWRLSLFSGNPELLHHLGLQAERQFKAYNGPIACLQKNYRIAQETQSRPTTHLASDFANRLAKNQLKLSLWAQREGVNCYRLYDADLPDYNVAIDRYNNHLVIQEYHPPSNIDAKKRQQRLRDLIQATLTVTQLCADQVVVKVRQRQRGNAQYQKLAAQETYLSVTEYNAQLWVNLTDYLDTGLFLDQRRTRRLLGQMAPGQDFLNLFCYTGSATVHAGLGGARSTTSVDLSNTYLEWAARNLKSNQLHGRQHRLIQADCLAWLAQCPQQFDLIFIDPPSFSNSKRMQHSFDVQRDHLSLLTQLHRLLRPQGKIIFTNNRRGFQLDQAGIEQLQLSVETLATQTLSPDFIRRRPHHYCCLLQHKI